MKQRRQTLKSFLRFFAGGMVCVWLASVIMCSSVCSGEDCHCNVAQAATANGQSHDSDKDHDHDDSFCISLHHLCLPSNITFAKPDFSLILTLNLDFTTQLAALTQPEIFILRQPPDANRVFTPEVCLGPAFHSLAPPVFA